MQKNDTYRAAMFHYEKKYIITSSQYHGLKASFGDKMAPDKYPHSQITSLYFDSPKNRLISHSLENLEYKEKLRLRSYVIPNDETLVFVELKRKYRGAVYKRRRRMTLAQAENYLLRDASPPPSSRINSNITNEINYFLSKNPDLRPAMYIYYDRESWGATQDQFYLRLTIDNNIRWRNTDLDIRNGNHGELYLNPDLYILEIKSPIVIPLWLAKSLSEQGIYESSVSKYASSFHSSMTDMKLDLATKYSIPQII